MVSLEVGLAPPSYQAGMRVEAMEPGGSFGNIWFSLELSWQSSPQRGSELYCYCHGNESIMYLGAKVWTNLFFILESACVS